SAGALERAGPGVVQEGAGEGDGGAGQSYRSDREGPRLPRGTAHPSRGRVRGGPHGHEGRDGQASLRRRIGVAAHRARRAGPEGARLLAVAAAPTLASRSLAHPSLTLAPSL